MLLIAIKRDCPQSDRFRAAEEGARCIRRDAIAGISEADVRLHVQVVVAVSKIECQIRISN